MYCSGSRTLPRARKACHAAKDACSTHRRLRGLRQRQRPLARPPAGVVALRCRARRQGRSSERPDSAPTTAASRTSESVAPPRAASWCRRSARFGSNSTGPRAPSPSWACCQRGNDMEVPVAGESPNAPQRQVVANVAVPARKRITREDLVVRLSRAMGLVREYRAGRALSRAATALLRAAADLATVSETSTRADELRATALSLPTVHRHGDRWALAHELEALHAEGAPSHRVAHALFDIGCCTGERRAGDLQRCAAWARSERRRYRREKRRA
jgi:hypothetical protein